MSSQQKKISDGTNIAFQVTDKDITKLVSILKDFGEIRKIIFSLSDGTEQIYKDVSEAIEYQNPSAAYIIQISILVLHGYNDYANITLKQNSRTGGGLFIRSHSISWYLEGDTNKVLNARNQIELWISGVTAWYSPISRISIFGVGTMSLLFFALLAIIGGNLALYLLTKTITFSTNVSGEGWAFGFLINVVWLGIFAILAFVFSKLFPSAVFLIGHGAKRNEIRMQLRMIIGVAVIIPIVLTLMFD